VSAVIEKIRFVAPLLSRIVIALFGGYGLAALSSMAMLALPMTRPEAVLAGTLLSFVVYVLAAIWVFAARSARWACGGMVLAAVLLLLATLTV
jgi:hypothetical protein